MLRDFTKCASLKCLLLLIAWLSSAFLFGQIPAPGSGPGTTTLAATPGTVTGHVHGPGGVSVPGADIVITNPLTGERKETWSDDDGNYTFSGLIPGNYRLSTSLLGFRPDTREPIPVSPGATLKVNVALVVGGPGEEAAQTAQASRPAGNGAARSGAGGNGNRSIAEYQNGGGQGGNGQFPSILRLSEGNGSEEGATSPEAMPEEAENSASANNSFLLGGGMGEAAEPGMGGRFGRGGFGGFGNGFGGPGGQGGGPGSPFGEGGGPGGRGGGPGGGGGGGGFRGGGGGGGGARGWSRNRAAVNRIRGNFTEQYTNSALDAHPFPLNIAESPQIPSYQETFGFSLGGPLVIPHIYKGGNKTSWFASYNLQRGRTGHDSFSTVPTQLERQGNFSQTVIASGADAGSTPTIYEPLSSLTAPGTPFPGNTIPSTQIIAAATGLLAYIPLPNLPGEEQNFHLQEPLPSSNDRVMGRIGQTINARNSLNVMYYFNSARSRSVSGFPDFTSHTTVLGQNVSVGYSHTFNTHLVNSANLNFNRQRTSLLNAFAYNDDIAYNLGIMGVSNDPFDWGVPGISFTNFGSLSDPIPSLARPQTVRANDTLIWNHGKHNFHMGGELRRVQSNTETDPNARGTFSFTGYSTSEFSNGFPVTGTGYDFADFLLGLPQTTSVRFGVSPSGASSNSTYLRNWVTTAFWNDDWRTNNHLTVNYGVRYEYFLPAAEKYGHLADLEFAPNFASPSVATGLTGGSLPPSLIHSDAHNFSPRIGIAYRPWIRHHLVIRSGYGVFYDGSIYSRMVTNMIDQPPFAIASTQTTNALSPLTLQDGFPGEAATLAATADLQKGFTCTAQTPCTNTYAADSNYRRPYAQSWNFFLEDEIYRNVILSVGYVGTKGSKLDLLLSPDRLSATTSGGATSSIPGVQQFLYETDGADSIYNGLQVTLRRQFHGGFSMSGYYTWSKSIDDAASVGGTGQNVPQNSSDLAAERALSNFNVTNKLIINHTYEFPFGEQRRWLNRGGFAGKTIGDWQISGVTTLESGSPETAQVAGNESNNNGSGVFASERADATGLPIALPRSERGTEDFFNTAAFSLPASGQLGTAGRNTIIAPGSMTFNMSLGRFFTFSREKNLRARFSINANNIFNHPNWSSVATTINAENFGWVTGVSAMRSINFALRFNF